jgi:NADH-quinone oxidoreductase subunit A
MGSELSEYAGVLMLALAAAALSVGMLVFSVVLGKVGRRNAVKDTAYECGMAPVGEGNPRLSIRFYLLAMLFILFDIEVVFLYPWAVVYRRLLADGATANLVFLSMLGFLGVLAVGYVYALKKGAFDWRN